MSNSEPPSIQVITMSALPLTLVLGANGKTGRRVSSRLRAAGWPVRAGSRSGSPRFDWNEPATWDDALRAVDQLYITFQPDLAIPGAVDTIEAFVDQAVKSGVGRLVLLSGRNEEAAQECEQVVLSSGVPATVVRASFFAQNFSEGPFAMAVASGVFPMPTLGVGEPFVDTDDIADVAFAALTEHGHAGEVYEVTGPRLLTFSEAIAEVSEASGHAIRFVEVTPDEYEAGLVKAGLPNDYAAFLTELFTTVLDGRNAYTTDGVERALGRRPRDFTTFARLAAADGAWRLV